MVEKVIILQNIDFWLQSIKNKLHWRDFHFGFKEQKPQKWTSRINLPDSHITLTEFQEWSNVHIWINRQKIKIGLVPDTSFHREKCPNLFALLGG